MDGGKVAENNVIELIVESNRMEILLWSVSISDRPRLTEWV